MPEFLAENNLCGQSILQLVSRGNAIIAEILRLKDYVPSIFKLETKQEVTKYGEIISDFSYFKVAEAYEHKIENNDTLRDLDEEFRDNHIKIITRFYLLFESIHTYITDLNQFLLEVEEGIFIHQSIETIMADVEGKQLLCEALYLYGTILLLVDGHINGIIRERLLVAYYRYTPQRRDSRSCIDEVCKLLRDTEYHNKRPNNYPEDYFKRINIKSSYIDLILGRLRTDDIYNQLSVYPKSSHRSFALTTQASMLYVCLFFSAQTLHHQTAVMREIVDKYFPDNWVIPIYMGFNVNLAETWDSFKAAKMALNNTLEQGNIKSYVHSYSIGLVGLYKSTVNLLKEGTITSDNVLNNNNNIINVLRDCNVTIRWLILHTAVDNKEKNKRCKQLREYVINESKLNPVHLFKLLLNTAQLELITRELLKSILEAKEEKWKSLKDESSNRLKELAEVFGGEKPLARVQKNTHLKKWFIEISTEVDSLEFGSENSSRKLIQLIQALEEVQEFHQLDANMQVIQFLSETRSRLHKMVRNMNIKEEMLITMQIIGDLSYAWEIIDTYTPIMQTGIQKEPTLVINLRAVFLKLASAMEIPLLRINQSHSVDLLSVSEYYSRELEVYIRKVLQIIPKMMFQKMAKIVEMQTTVLKELPTRLDKDKLKEYAQLNERFEFAELSHSISVFSQGMRMMKSTLVGVVCLDPKVLLEDGIRKELVSHIAQALHNQLIFSTKHKSDELDQKLKSLVKIMDGYKRSFEYIQDYVNINGLKIWQEEVTRIINYNVEQECNGFLRNKIHKWDSAFQNRHVPIPHLPSIDGISENFIGRLAREVIRMTDPKSTSYIAQTTTWYDAKTQKTTVNKQTIALISSAIEITGLAGLDRLFSFMIVTNLKKIFEIFENKQSKNLAWNNIINNICIELKSLDKQQNPMKFYQNWINRSQKLFTNVIDLILRVGQLQLLRNLIAFHLNTSCKFNAKNLESSLRSLNNALLNDLKSSNADVQISENFLKELSNYFDYTGLNNPFCKVYLTTKSIEQHSVIVFLVVVTHLNKLFLFHGNGSSSNKRSNDLVDGAPFAIGIYTVLKQLHSNINEEFIDILSQYILNSTKSSLGNKNEIALEAVLSLRFMDQYVNYSTSSLNAFKRSCPDEIIHVIKSISSHI